MANPRVVEDQEPWRLVDEDTDQHSHPLFRMSLGMKMLGDEEEKESKCYPKRNERFRRNVIQYFQEIIQTFHNVETGTNPQPRHPMGRRRRAGERTRKPGPRTRLQVVSSECLSERARDKPGPVPLPHRTGGRLRGTEERLLPSSLARKSARATLSRLHQDDSKVLHKEEMER